MKAIINAKEEEVDNYQEIIEKEFLIRIAEGQQEE